MFNLKFFIFVGLLVIVAARPEPAVVSPLISTAYGEPLATYGAPLTYAAPVAYSTSYSSGIVKPLLSPLIYGYK